MSEDLECIKELRHQLGEECKLAVANCDMARVAELEKQIEALKKLSADSLLVTYLTEVNDNLVNENCSLKNTANWRKEQNQTDSEEIIKLRKENIELKEINAEWIERCNILIKGIKATNYFLNNDEKLKTISCCCEYIETDEKYTDINSALDLAEKGVYPTRKKGVEFDD